MILKKYGMLFKVRKNQEFMTKLKPNRLSIMSTLLVQNAIVVLLDLLSHMALKINHFFSQQKSGIFLPRINLPDSFFSSTVIHCPELTCFICFV
jgi:hypothetical protein